MAAGGDWARGRYVAAQHWTRRHFLSAAAVAGLSIAGACAPRLVIPTVGPPRGTLRLAFYTDVHARSEGGTPRALEQAAAFINDGRPDLVLGGGDYIHGGFANPAAKVSERWDVYMAMHRAIEGEQHVAIGNHDLVAAAPQDGSPPSADPRQPFRDRLGIARTYRSFDALGCHFILLDSVDVIEGDAAYRGFIDAAQLAWLDEDLAELTLDTPIVLVTHIPLVTSFFGVTNGMAEAAEANRVVVNNVDVLNRFEGRNLILVLQGHLHIKEMIRWRRTTFITGGAICAKWWQGAWHDTEEGFCRLLLARDRVEWEYVDYGWQV